MTTSKTSRASLPVRIGLTVSITAAALIGTATPGSAATAPVLTATPATGAADTVISLTTTTANVFKAADGSLKMADQDTDDVPDANSVIFTPSACPTTGAAIPDANLHARKVTDAIFTKGASTLTSATAAFVDDVLANGGDRGVTISGAGIAAGTTISAVTDPNTITLSKPTTAASPVAGQDLLIGSTGPYVPQSITIVNNSRLVVKAPHVIGSGAYNICVFDNAGATPAPLATAKFTVYDKPTAAAHPTPASGPSAGGTVISITGTGFTSKSTATIDGLPLTVKLTTGSSTELTATVPAHKVGDANIIVSTEGGPSDATVYTYKDGINVTPQSIVGDTGDGGKARILDITGAGFTDFAFTGAAALGDGKSHIVLVQADFRHATTAGGGTSANDKAECKNVVVISDLELICTLDPTTDTSSNTSGKIANGSYQVMIVKDATADHQFVDDHVAYRQTIMTSGSVLTVAPY